MGVSPSFSMTLRALCLSSSLLTALTPMLPLWQEGFTMIGKPHSGHGCGMGVPMRAISSLDFSLEQEVLYDSMSKRRCVPHSGTVFARNSSTSRFSTAGMTASHSLKSAFALS